MSKIWRVKRFSYSEISSGLSDSAGYISAQVGSGIIRPLDYAVERIETTKIGELPQVKKKTTIVRQITRPIRKLIHRRRDRLERMGKIEIK